MIVAEGLTRTYGDVTAVDGVSFEVHSGEIFGLLGPDGAGKTTLFRMLGGVLEPTAGTARIAGLDTRAHPDEVKAKIGYMPQAFALYRDLTVEENLRFAAEMFAVPRDAVAGRLERLLRFSQLGPFTHRLAEYLSGGMRQKLALAATLIHEPDVLLLDEPTTGVDPVSRREFWQILGGLHETGKTIVVATPYMDEAERCGRLALIHQGRVLTVESPQALKGQMEGVLLEVVASPRRTALATIEHLPRVLHRNLFGDRLHLVVAGRDVIESVGEALRGAGVAVESITVIEPSLEDVFVSLLASPRTSP
jgi:ABC-2 type transport system ATP-binding protein